jgi:UDP-glucose 4-epimerase
MKKIMITGSMGFISTNMQELYKDKYEFVEIDRLAKSTDELAIQDFKDVIHIVHLGAISGIQACESDKDDAVKYNVLSTIDVVNWASILKIPITFASSQAAKNPENTYALTKKIGEDYILQNNIHSYILRFANVYGGLKYFGHKTSVIAKMFDAVQKEEPIYVNGIGTQERDFIHVDDICQAIHLSIETKQKNNVILDVGTGKGTSILDLARMISTDSILYRKNSGSIGIGSSISDLKKTQKMLSSFKPIHNLKDDIVLIKDMFKEK